MRKTLSDTLRELLFSALIGIGIGHLITLLSFAGSQLETITLHRLIITAVFSGLIGMVSALVFKLLPLPAKAAYPLHFFLTLCLVLLMVHFNDWLSWEQLSRQGLLIVAQISLVYLAVWLVILYLNHQQVSKINAKIKERKAQRK